MLTLGIDTSGLGGSIAIARDGNCLAERALSRTGRRHARTLVAELKALFDDTRLRPHDCNTVAVSIGPGSFTGLRVGVVCAKTFAYATRCTLVAVDTHLAVAAASPDDVAKVAVISDALRGEVYAGLYERAGDRCWTTLQPVERLPFDNWTEELPDDAAISGPGLSAYGEDLSQRTLLPEQVWNPQARWIALLGEHLAENGQSDDLVQLVPKYLRKSAAEEKADRQNAT
ncbi:tRNA (adenosine(37)-N6)-threonylcarbamoyltransferase complex dimerization subunit type 1 TsaB [Maioricimonas sp. JC845]|uniref:tRNA (adenosine(37)-N6)-threonylcarbamoyltransferase complex dimerization subunit type 1 TsaB n=1 Tax=Maioricimonas sp. JC845 TaxID=3232138 RepID=UPI003458D510